MLSIELQILPAEKAMFLLGVSVKINTLIMLHLFWHS